ncbi:MAG: CDP-alcohol phosphatidyltransferase family protein, partial [Phycisphaerae bacterium]|nr:CDP-alcohol phosphatidyltransferase family protein [Phycisphaerae bacterium]NIP55074.1 CDP-alcohol phosphatidyltransferase family protein [Phycisphaerae bacterium]NIU11360.1 CDP-alcohol phosphatidyltransferase family protein [Phycisphaerae bacterium]NIX31209.1 hypothetical protein [Phycisphaerae bacterium]
MLAAILLSLILQSINPVLWTAMAVFGAYIFLRFAEEGKSVTGFGLGNLITASRLIILMIVGGLLSTLAPSLIALLLTLNVALDYLDGHLARSRKEASEFGRVFDQSVDSFYVL